MRPFLCFKHLVTLLLFVAMFHPNVAYALFPQLFRGMRSAEKVIRPQNAFPYRPHQEVCNTSCKVIRPQNAFPYRSPQIVANVYPCPIRPLKGLKDDYSITLNKDKSWATIHFKGLNVKEARHKLYALEILQEAEFYKIKNNISAFKGDFSKASVKVEPDLIEIIVPIAESSVETNLLVRIAGKIPVSLKNILNSFSEGKSSCKDIFNQLIHDLEKHNIRPENVRCEFLQGTMAFNNIDIIINGLNNENNFA